MATTKKSAAKTPAKKPAARNPAAKNPARKSTRKYSPAAGDEVGKEMHDFKRGKARSGPGGQGGKVQSRKQAVAIGLAKARAKGKKVPAQMS